MLNFNYGFTCLQQVERRLLSIRLDFQRNFLKGRTLFVLFLLQSLCVTLNAQETIAIEYGPYLQNVQEDEVTIVWTTTKPGIAWVEIAPDDDSHFYAEKRKKYFHASLGLKQVGTTHQVRIDSLQAGKSYRYRIFTQEAEFINSYNLKYGKIASSNVYKEEPFRFSTLDRNKKNVNYLFVNDIHSDVELLQDLYRGCEDENFDGVIMNGDMVSIMDGRKEFFEGFIETSCELFAKELPMYLVRGNHETRGIWATEYMNYCITDTKQPYYAFRQGELFIIVLDSGEDKPDDDIEYLGVAHFDTYREEQQKWLEQVVETEACLSASRRVVVAHIPPTSKQWYGNQQLMDLYVPILNKSDIDIMICGHTHDHEYREKGNEGINFPILINDDEHCTILRVENNSLSIEIQDRKGKVFKEVNL